MSLANLAARVEERRKATKHNVERRILVLDIERLPGRARHQHRGLTIEGDFWDLGSWKSTIGYRLPPEAVIEPPRTICAAWRWLGGEKIHFTSEWQHGQQGMFERLWEAIDKADVIAGHNYRGFDRRHINTGFRDHGMPPPSPYKVLDTLTIARQHFGDESMKLQSLTTRMGLAGKTDAYQVQVAKDAVNGDKAAQKKLRDYNLGDIPASEALALTVLPWATGIPHVAPTAGLESTVCPRCGSGAVTRNGTYTPAVRVYAAYRCDDCGGNFRGRGEHNGPTARAI